MAECFPDPRQGRTGGPAAVRRYFDGCIRFRLRPSRRRIPESTRRGGSASTMQPLFIDEAQDMGPATLRLLLSIVEQSDPADDNSRSAHIFYDNAQNIYGRRTPRWSDFGVDLRGRSTILKESFRSTKPVTEFAVNMLHRLSPSSIRQDQAELMSAGLIERTERLGQDWLAVKYNQVFGPKPIFRKFDGVEQELRTIVIHLMHLITKEGVSPGDICLIYNGPHAVELLQTHLGPAMADIGVEISVQTSRAYQRQENTLLVTTSHSFKGYEAEVVLIPCADQYVTSDNQILANNLYVAMTRARSLLAVYSLDRAESAVRRLNDAFEFCVTAPTRPRRSPPTPTATSSRPRCSTALDCRIGSGSRRSGTSTRRCARTSACRWVPFHAAACPASELSQILLRTAGRVTAVLWEGSETASEVHAGAL